MAAPQLMRRSTLALIFPRHWRLPLVAGQSRQYGHLPLVYDGEKDPAPYFFSSPVQSILKYLTRPDLSRVFRKRANRGDKALEAPEYKFLTNEELQKEIEKSNAKAEYLLQMPPVVKVHEDVERIISKDPHITAHDTTKYIFTDITFDLKHNERTIVVRDIDGKLSHANLEVRKRMIQAYFPMMGRKMKEPAMFTDPIYFNKLVEKQEYEFILDRACIQYEPEETEFQSNCAKVYQHCDQSGSYEILRSTRHFGPMTFYFAWHHTIDGLLLELLHSGILREATALISLQRCIHPQLVTQDETKAIVEEIFQAKDLFDSGNSRPLDVEVELEEKCIACVDNYIKTTSTRKGQQELALQAFRQLFDQRISVERGIRQAHGRT